MKEVEEINGEYARDCIHDLYILLNEFIIPYTLKRDFDKEFKQFELIRAFECMVDEVDRVKRVVELYDVIVQNPILLFDDYQLSGLLREFISFIPEAFDDADEVVNNFVKFKLDGDAV